MGPYWLNREDIQLGIMPRPRGHDWLSDDLRNLRQAGVDVLVSALTPSESEALGLMAEAEECARNGLHFISFPVEDRSLPENGGDFRALINRLVELSKSQKSVVIHCRAGIGRSSLIAACVLTSLGWTPDAAFIAIAEARGCSVPDTPEQRQWVELYDPYRAATRNFE